MIFHLFGSFQIISAIPHIQLQYNISLASVLVLQIYIFTVSFCKIEQLSCFDIHAL